MILKNTIEPFAVGFLNADQYDDMGYKIACGMLNQAKFMPLVINPDAFFAGQFDVLDSAIKTRYPSPVFVNKEMLEREISEFPEEREELLYIQEKMLPLDNYSAVINARTPLETKLCDMRVCWGGHWGGHGNPDFGAFVKLGTKAIREKIEEYRKINVGKDAFYDGLALSMEAIEVLGERYCVLARKMALRAEGDAKKQLLRIAECLSHCPKNPARDFFEACQMFWLIFSFTEADSPGRFDQYMITYYRNSPKEDADLCMRKLWERFYDSRTWNLCISGSDANGNDETNELSYLILELAGEYKYNTPNLTMRVYKNTPQKLLRKAIEVFGTGIGMPVLYNDDCVVPMLEALGIPKTDAHRYCMNGCNQIDIFGKSHMGLEDGEVCLFKTLELYLFGGVCQISDEKLGKDICDVEALADYDAFLTGFKKEIEYITDITVKMANDGQKIYGTIGVNPLRSCLVSGCIEKGKDYKAGGPLYNHGQILTEGIADTADALAAIKHFVFEEQKYTMRELKEALRNDFVGYEELHKDFSGFKKFGNDDAYVDSIAADIVEHYFSYLRTKETYRGGTYTGGCSPFNRAAMYGSKIGAMPNGKRKDDPVIADSIGAVPGEDKNGCTALLNSALKYNHALAGSGFVLNLKFNKSMFKKEQGIDAIEALIKTYFANGGQQISPSVVSPEELKDAIVHPEKHKDLIIRVGGYSDYFVKLSPGLQKNILQRTLIEV